jgi:hypothetical protein
MTKLLSTILIVLLAGCANDPEIRHVKDNDYQITGKLHKLEYDQIIAIVKNNPDARINFYVTSHGGTSEDLFEAMDTVYQHGDVHWYVLDDCSSACAVLALSTRHANGELRLHSFYQRKYDKVIPAPEYNQQVLEHLKKYGYETARLNYMFHSVEELWPVTIDDGKIKE